MNGTGRIIAGPTEKNEQVSHSAETLTHRESLSLLAAGINTDPLGIMSTDYVNRYESNEFDPVQTCPLKQHDSGPNSTI